MKIVLANNYYYLLGGCERVLFDDEGALVAAGHDVRPFAPYDERNSPAISASFFPHVSDYMAARGIGRAQAAVNLVRSTSAGRAFAEFLDDFRPDIVHCHNIYGRLTTAVLDEARRRRIPVVLTVHDHKLTCPAYLGLRQGEPCQLCTDGGYWRCLRWKCHKESTAASFVYTIEAYYNRLSKKYDAVSQFLCPSRFMQAELIESGIQEERTVYHPNAIPVTAYSPQFEPGNYALYAGRLSPEKGILTMMEAFGQARIPLRIAGSGPLDAEIRDLVERRNLPVTLEGFCDGPRLAQLYRGAAFVIVPSEWYENAPMSILESFAHGKPVLASDIGGNPELVVDHEVGRVFPVRNVSRLKEMAMQMWTDKDGLRAMGRRARRMAESQYDQKRRISDLVNIYENVIGRAASGAEMPDRPQGNAQSPA